MPAQEPDAQLAPPQPPLPDKGDAPPPVVDGIEQDSTMSVEDNVDTDTQQSSPPPEAPPEDDGMEPVRRGDLAAFAELFARFQTRVEKPAAGRKHRPLREAWDAASAEILRDPEKIDLYTTSELVVNALRLGCESGKVVVVDACLDCIHRLFEYGHIGSPGDSTDVALDARDSSLDDLIAMVCACLEVKNEEVFLRMVQTLLTAATRTRSGLHHGTLLAAVRTIYNINLNAQAPGTRTTARVSLTQILNLVFARMEAETAEDLTSITNSFTSNHKESQETATGVDVPEPARPAEEGGDASSEFSTVLQKDAYLLFRALCRLSGKDMPAELTEDAVPLRSKLLSLELLKNLISHSGPAFRSLDRFVYALRQYLAPSLLTNCMSNSLVVMDISFDIFEMLLRKDTLRPLLKNEIGALFEAVVFRFLESHTAGPMRKRRAITFLHKLSGDQQTMADLFLNYDCDLDSPKVFEHMVNVLSAAAQVKSPPRDQTAVLASASRSGHMDTKIVALTSIIQVVRSLREWSKPLEDLRDQAKSGISATGVTASESEGSELPNGQGANDEASPNHEEEESEEGAELSSSMKKSPSRTRGGGAGSLVLGVVSEGSDRDTTRFEQALKTRREMAEAISLFNSKPKRGIEFLLSTGRLKKDPIMISEFLHKTENLDATMVGEYLGEGGAFNISVMHAYTDMNEFSSLTFDGALRMHLSGFRLPGEAQKIDRIMEKFASRYCECNPDIFANADAAYVLAYSTIMLHTDAHNDTIKKKMTKEDFIKNNRGINDGGDLDPNFLSGLYDRITTTEIKLVDSKKDSAAGTKAKALDGGANVVVMDLAQRARKFEEESERLMAETKRRFANSRRTAQDYTYYSATNVHHARLMFDTAWFPVLAAVSLNLEDASPSENTIVALCLDGFRNGIVISSTFSMATTKDALVSSLAKFTHLNSISEMRPKNVECVRMILAIAANEGNSLGEQWVTIVRAISQLEQIRAVAAGNPDKYVLQKSPLVGIGSSIQSGVPAPSANGFSNDETETDPSLSANSSRKPTSGLNGTTYRRTSSGKSSSPYDVADQRHDSLVHKIDAKAASAATTIAESEIERIFMNSSRLSAPGVTDFCGALCTVSLEELSENPSPRLFCLQKIVELAYYNMEARTRIEWGRIWLKMGPFFVSAMCHDKRDVAMYSVDALRQLASKFLDKDELSNFSFQRSFLKPFEMCFSRSNSIPIRELVLSCVSQIVLARAANIKSGWKSVFAVLALAADDKIEGIMNFGWQIVDSIVRKYVGVLDDVYVDSVTGIAAYARSSVSTPVSLAAIGLLSGRCAASLADGHALSILKQQQPSDNRDGAVESEIWFSDVDAHIGAWFPILTGLASAMQDERSPIRAAANDGLYAVLTNHGGRFAPSLWALIFRGVLAPIFDDVRHLSTSSDRGEAAAVGEWATTTGSTSLKSLVDVFVLHIKVTRILLSDILGLIRSWILQETEVVAREGMSILARLVMTAGEVLEPEDWKILKLVINNVFVDTMPHEILGPDKLESSTHSKGHKPDILSDGGRENVIDNAKEQKIIGEEETNSGFSKESNANHTEKSSDNERNDEPATAETTRETRTSRKIDFRVVRAKCVVQLLLIQLVQEIVVSFYRVLSTEDILGLSESLEMSYRLAHDFNANTELRYSLWQSGFMNQVPNLWKQETNGLMAHLRIIFWLYLDPTRSDEGASTEDKVMALCESVLQGYIRSCDEASLKAEERREVLALSPVVCFIVNGLMQMSATQFEKHLPRLYGILLHLLERADEAEVRRAVIQVFKGRLKPVAADQPDSFLWAGDTEQRRKCHIGQPQLPGPMRERTVRTELHQTGGQTSSEICAALNKVGGVRSVVESSEENAFCVISSAPDEMLVAGVRSLPYVKDAIVDVSFDVELD